MQSAWDVFFIKVIYGELKEGMRHFLGYGGLNRIRTYDLPDVSRTL